jgi:hypothetical protein
VTAEGVERMALRCRGGTRTGTRGSLRLTSPQRSRQSVPERAAPLRLPGVGRREREHRQVSGHNPAAPPPPPQVRVTGRPATAASAHYGSRTMARTTSATTPLTSASSPTRPARVGGGRSAGERKKPSKGPGRGTHTAPGPPLSPMMTPWTPTWRKVKVPLDDRDALVFGAELDAWERALMGF